MEKNPNLGGIEVTELNIVETTGLQSHVKRFSELKQQTVTIGHVAFFDFEDTTLTKVKKYVDDYIGFGFIFKSSQGNFHVIKPVVKSIAEIHSIKNGIYFDCDAHADIGLKKGCWTLRIGDKGDKQRPEYITYKESLEANPKTEILSYPHLRILAYSYDSEKALTMLNECKTVGDTTNIVEYSTASNNHEVDDR